MNDFFKQKIRLLDVIQALLIHAWVFLHGSSYQVTPKAYLLTSFHHRPSQAHLLTEWMGGLIHHMKNLSLVLIVFSTVISSNSAYAANVFKCINQDGQISFSFSTCPYGEADIVDEYIGPIIEERLIQIEAIDQQISRIHRQLRDLELENNYSLRTASNVETEDQIQLDYQKALQDLQDQLSMQETKREELVQDSVALLSETRP